MDLYLVGGAVRDRLLGLPLEERDWVVVGASADEMRARGFRQVGRDFPVFLHPETGEEYALARTERKSGRGHHGFEVHSDPSVTLEEDLKRRDLTINAMAMDEDGTLIDPYGGALDLEARRLRHVAPAFVEDPLRVLRVARFAARFAHLAFTVDPSTLALMREIVASGELETLPAERIWGEFEKALVTKSPARFLEVLENCQALTWLLPGLADRDGAVRRLATAAETTEDASQRFAALFHSVLPEQAKVICKSLKPPRRYRELAGLMATLGERLPDIQTLSAAERLAVLQQADALRRPERFEAVLEACRALLPNTAEAMARWRQALAACEAVDTRRVAESGLSGEAIGERVRSLREQALKALD